MKIFCLIPAFNEYGNLTELVRRLTNIFNRLRIDSKIFFVLQGNHNNLSEITKIQKIYKKTDFIYYSYPLGIGRAYQKGFKKINSKWTHVLTLDADLNHSPEELPKLINNYRNTKSDVVIGSRFISGGQSQDNRQWKTIASQIVNKIINKILGISIADKTSGFRLIKTELLLRIRNKLKEKDYPSYLEFIILAIKSKALISEEPITYIPRIWGKSKMNKFSTAVDYLIFLPKIIYDFYKPTPTVHHR